MKRIQHSTGQPSMDTCQWWNTSSKVLDLTLKTRKRSVCKHSSLVTFFVPFLHGYLYSVKCHTVPYMYYCAIFVHYWQQSGLTLEVFICLSACNYIVYRLLFAPLWCTCVVSVHLSSSCAVWSDSLSGSCSKGPR